MHILFLRILLAKLYCTHFIGTTFFTVRNFVVTTSPSNATNKNCEKVMIFPAPGSFLFSENKIIRSISTHTHTLLDYLIRSSRKTTFEQQPKNTNATANHAYEFIS